MEQVGGGGQQGAARQVQRLLPPGVGAQRRHGAARAPARQREGDDLAPIEGGRRLLGPRAPPQRQAAVAAQVRHAGAGRRQAHPPQHAAPGARIPRRTAQPPHLPGPGPGPPGRAALGGSGGCLGRGCARRRGGERRGREGWAGPGPAEAPASPPGGAGARAAARNAGREAAPLSPRQAWGLARRPAGPVKTPVARCALTEEERPRAASRVGDGGPPPPNVSPDARPPAAVVGLPCWCSVRC